MLESTKTKLRNIDRNEIIKPSKPLLINNLRIHNPDLLSTFNVKINVEREESVHNLIYIVMPFYKNIPNMQQLIIGLLLKEGNRCTNLNLRGIF